MRALEPFVGEWQVELPGAEVEPGLAVFEWTLGGAFLLQRVSIPVEGAPDGLCVITPSFDGDGWTQHYYDSRGVVRLYAMGFDGREWTLERRRADFSPLRFHQRWRGRLSDDGATIEGAWEIAHDGATFETDFPLVYRKV